jgi:hypothetical protein
VCNISIARLWKITPHRWHRTLRLSYQHRNTRNAEKRDIHYYWEKNNDKQATLLNLFK